MTDHDPEVDSPPYPGIVLLTIEEVASLTRLPVATLRYWRHLGTGPKSLKVGRHVRYRAHDVAQWLDHLAASTTE